MPEKTASNIFAVTARLSRVRSLGKGFIGESLDGNNHVAGCVFGFEPQQPQDLWIHSDGQFTGQFIAEDGGRGDIAVQSIGGLKADVAKFGVNANRGTGPDKTG